MQSPPGRVSRTASSGSLIAKDISKFFGANAVLERVSITVGPRARIAVVGSNGSGKSTLLEILAGIQSPDEGRIRASPMTLVGYVPQEIDIVEGETLGAYLARRTGVAAAERAMDSKAAVMGTDLERIAAYTDAVECFVALGGEDIGARAAEVVTELGLGAELLERPIASLSGGQSSRAPLAAILLSRFDILLLDEPTNDLDFEGLRMLERFIQGLDSSLVVVSHDRAFLERTVDRVVELSDGSGGVQEYAGGYAAFLAERERRNRRAYGAYQRYLDQRRNLMETAAAQRKWGASGQVRAKRRPRDPDKNLREAHIARAQKTAAKAATAERRIERLDQVDKPWESWRLELSFGDAPRGGDVVFRFNGAVVHRGSFKLGPVDLEVRFGDRLAIVGSNGSGKSTLVDALLGRLPLDEGRARRGSGVVVGVMDQPRRLFASKRPILEIFCERSGLLPQEARSLLAKFSIGASHVDRAAESLSPGERSRGLLALLASYRANCLVLDEPTNHLDLKAIEQLERALNDYAGTVITVTHDRLLLERLRGLRRICLQDGRVTADTA
jgi:ATPase subunit of ABC transporter with duplicated ATPase domains